MHSFGQLRSHTQQTLSSWLNLVFNQPCTLCDRPTQNTFCVDCQRQLQATFDSSLSTLQRADDTLTIYALAPYAVSLKQALSALKYNHCPRIGAALGIAVAQRWSAMAAHPDYNASRGAASYVIPIPLHPNRQAQRGYNQAELIANAFSRASGLTTLAHGLLRTQDTLPLHQLGLGDRQKNLQSAFAVGKALHKLRRRTKAPLRILLIDDIYTTGATAQSAAQTLRAANIRVTGMLTLASAMTD